jgi:hypothetical protein
MMAKHEMIILDCGDNSCVFAPRPLTGMRTNGGCRCFRDLTTKQRLFITQTWQIALQHIQRVKERDETIAAQHLLITELEKYQAFWEWSRLADKQAFEMYEWKGGEK